MNAQNLMLKVIVLVHFILSTWGCMGNFMPTAYTYVNGGVLVCGFLAITHSESSDAVLMTLMALLFSILEDIIILALYEPRGYRKYEQQHVSQADISEYRFALGMSIANLLLKPLSAFLLYRLYKARNNEEVFSIPGIDRLPGMGGGHRGGYSDIDSNPNPAPYNDSPSQSPPPHGSVDKE